MFYFHCQHFFDILLTLHFLISFSDFFCQSDMNTDGFWKTFKKKNILEFAIS